MSSNPILIIDDDTTILEMIADLLSYEGYTITATNKGSVALDRARAEPPALILLDLMMPEMSGWQVVAALSGSQRTRSIPVILLSARRDLATTAAELGATAFLEKPFELDALLDLIKQYVQLDDSTNPQEGSTAN